MIDGMQRGSKDMKTLAIVGAGPGLGLGIAKRFGAEGFNLALLARTREKLDGLVADLDGLGMWGTQR
jgi:short-subunit dehydrogenase